MSEDDEAPQSTDLARDRLALERERLKFERQKLSIEVLQKRRDSIQAKRKPFGSALANPLTLAIAGGFISLMTTIISGYYNAAENRRAEAQKADLARISSQDTLQADLIKKFTEGPRPVVRENLKFLLEVGLLPTYANQVRSYLERNPEAAPQANYSGIQGEDDAIALGQLAKADPLVSASRSVGLLSFGSMSVCTAFLVAADRAITAGHCIIPQDGTAQLVVNGRTLAVQSARKIFDNRAEGDYAVLALGGNTEGLVGLSLASQAPAVGDRLKLLMYRGGVDVPLAVQSPRCHVVSVVPPLLSHGCDTGPGTAGAPILSEDGRFVVGIHAGRNQDGTGFGTLASVVLLNRASP
ncbi:trypsin-like serine peptidase [Methylobacterium nonmethylotrophicum]|nr:serine protease [Methylobacterium nonmethylotrophicum]